MVNKTYTTIRKRLFQIIATILFICTLAAAGISQMLMVARFHQLNALHLQASEVLRSLLIEAAPALPDSASLRRSVINIRAQSFACLEEIGWLERHQMRWLGHENLVALCEEDVEQADHTLMLINDYTAGSVAASSLASQIEACSLDFIRRSEAFIAPVSAVGDIIMRWTLAGLIVTGLIALGIVAGIVSQVKNAVKELQRANESLTISEKHNRQLAMFDRLTDLPNRNLLMDRLESVIADTQRSRRVMALLFIDLDHFKDVNDSLGHDAGDELLIVVARRLQSVIRDSDTVARLGGDEFALILGRIAQPDDAAMVAQNILEIMRQPIQVMGIDHRVSASIGITLYPQNGVAGSDLLKQADLAMYAAKGKGRNGYQFFSHGSDEINRQRVHTAQLLQDATGQGQLRLHFQPIINLKNGATLGAEALVRWQHPEDGLVYPDKFITLAEEGGTIVEIGMWVLDTALAQCAQWRANEPAFIMAVNVSVRQLHVPALVDGVANLLARHAIPACNLHLEITESQFLSDDEVAASTLNRLSALGVVLSIDDFGTGYSSFSYLRQWPFQTLKIDRSFIHNLPESREASAVAAAIVTMASALGLEVVAEGIENANQYRFLQSLDCPMGQGYLFSKPTPANEFVPGRVFAVQAAAAPVGANP